jgi:DNA-binding Lrp family transcriptional regulator
MVLKRDEDRPGAGPDRALIRAIQGGLPLTRRPYARIGLELGLGEAEVIERIRALRDEGAIKRFGVVVNHRALGFRANGMVVWDIPDERVDEAARRLSEMDCVTLCYRRPRRPPHWPYNLFTMVHGRDEAAVRERIAQMAREAGLEDVPREVLFSRRCFKQRGARYA